MQQDVEDELGSKMAICGIALDRKVVVLATYNAAPVELHPHQLVERNGAVYLRAFNPAKNRSVGDETALGFYHLNGLTDMALAGKTFEPVAATDDQPPRAGDKVLQAL